MSNKGVYLDNIIKLESKVNSNLFHNPIYPFYSQKPKIQEMIYKINSSPALFESKIPKKSYHFGPLEESIGNVISLLRNNSFNDNEISDGIIYFRDLFISKKGGGLSKNQVLEKFPLKIYDFVYSNLLKEYSLKLS